MDAMERAELLSFLRAQKWAVQASVSPLGAPQAAAIGVVVTDRFEIVFDTFGDSRKAHNLRQNPKIALVIGWDDGQTVQYEGVADEPSGDELTRLKALYFARFPDGRERERLPSISYFRIRPSWLRYSDFRGDAPVLFTLEGAELWG